MDDPSSVTNIYVVSIHSVRIVLAIEASNGVEVL